MRLLIADHILLLLLKHIAIHQPLPQKRHLLLLLTPENKYRRISNLTLKYFSIDNKFII